MKYVIQRNTTLLAPHIRFTAMLVTVMSVVVQILVVGLSCIEQWELHACYHAQLITYINAQMI